jgi:hypothetical protein
MKHTFLLILRIAKFRHLEPNYPMSFQAYLDNIQAKTGKTPEEFVGLAEGKGFLKGGKLDVKATEITDWLKADFDLGHGHAMAMFAYFKGKRD